MSEKVTIEKKAFDVLQKNNLDLMEKLEKAKRALNIYAKRSNWGPNYTDSFCCLDGWEMAQNCLKEIEKMNDRFKFRVWDKEFNKYWTDEEIKENAAWLLFPDNDYINDVEIEQCTGLKDKNGKLIYEGDILYCMLNRPRKGVVEFYRNAFCLNENGSYSEDIIFSDKCCEVVGNIHENKELLK